MPTLKAPQPIGQWKSSRLAISKRQGRGCARALGQIGTQLAVLARVANLMAANASHQGIEALNGCKGLAVMSALLGVTAGAADLQVQVRVDVARGCQLVGQQRDAGVAQLGTLDFGITARLDDSRGPLGAALGGSRQPRLECNRYPLPDAHRWRPARWRR